MHDQNCVEALKAQNVQLKEEIRHLKEQVRIQAEQLQNNENILNETILSLSSSNQNLTNSQPVGNENRSFSPSIRDEFEQLVVSEAVVREPVEENNFEIERGYYVPI